MSEENSSKKLSDVLISPPVIGALISAVVAISLAVIPALINNANNTPIPTPIPPTATTTPTEEVAVVILPSATHTETAAQPTQTPNPPTATDVPPTATSVPPTATDVPPTATSIPPTNTPAPPTSTPPPPANVILLHDDASFTFYNQSNGSLDISNISFRSTNGRWDALNWGPSLAASLPSDNCLRVRDMTTGERQAPPICGTLFGFQVVGGSALFWLEVDSYEVYSNNTVIAVCQTSAETCPIFVE